MIPDHITTRLIVYQVAFPTSKISPSHWRVH